MVITYFVFCSANSFLLFFGGGSVAARCVGGRLAGVHLLKSEEPAGNGSGYNSVGRPSRKC